MGLAEELALVTKLKALSVPCGTIFDGVTTREGRLEKVRAAVKQVPDVTYTVRGGKCISMKQQYERVYGVPL